jgi:hypothetical protein
MSGFVAVFSGCYGNAPDAGKDSKTPFPEVLGKGNDMTLKEKTDSISRSSRIPPIDAEAPEKTETATFALG